MTSSKSAASQVPRGAAIWQSGLGGSTASPPSRSSSGGQAGEKVKQVFSVLGQFFGKCIGKGHVGETKYLHRQVRSMTKQRGFARGGMGLVSEGTVKEEWSG